MISKDNCAWPSRHRNFGQAFDKITKDMNPSIYRSRVQMRGQDKTAK